MFLHIGFNEFSGFDFDYAISIMGGAFELTSCNQDPVNETYMFVKKLHSILRVGGRAIIEFLNFPFILNEVSQDDIANGDFIVSDSLIKTSDFLYERAYTVSELNYVFKIAGFRVEKRITFDCTESTESEYSFDNHSGHILIEKIK